MANFVQNIAKIRGEAIYGNDMRTAIADAIEQAMDLDLSGTESVLAVVEDIGDGDFCLELINSQS